MAPGARFSSFDAVPWMPIIAGLGIAAFWFHGFGFVLKAVFVVALLTWLTHRWQRRAWACEAAGYDPGSRESRRAWRDERRAWREERRAQWRGGFRRMADAAESWCDGRDTGRSGNTAFDDYRRETLRRLEEAPRAFQEFLDKLRHAKDKAEFDQFMASRDRPPTAPTSPDML